VLDAILWTADAWDQVNPESITKYITKAGIVVVSHQTNKKTQLKICWTYN
jgi:hypothetical protein